MLNFFNKGLVNAKLTHTFSSHGSFNKTLSHFGDIHFFSTSCTFVCTYKKSYNRFASFKNYSTITSLEEFPISKQTIFFDYSPVYNVIKEILNNKDNKSNEELQFEIENYLYTSWINIIRLKIDQFNSKGGILAESFKLLHKYIIEYELMLNHTKSEIKKLKNFNKDPKFSYSFRPLFELNNEQISAIVFNEIIPLISSNSQITRNKLLSAIGEKLFHILALELYDKEYLDKNLSKNKKIKIYLDNKMKFKEFKTSLNITSYHCGTLGERLLQDLINMGTLIVPDYQKKDDSNESETIIGPSISTIKLFENSFDIIGFKLPMVCQPIPWNDNTDGGYLLNNNLHFDNLIHQGFTNISSTTITDKESIYGQINYMSNIPFKINKDVLNFIKENGIKSELILGSLHKNTNIIDTLTSTEKKEVLAHNSRYFQEKNILGIAELFKDVDKFYLPLFFDWRGRIYSNTSYFHYQSIGLAKSLIVFAEGSEINKNNLNNSLYWLKIYGANCFGKGVKKLDKQKYSFKSSLEKLSFNDREIWINKNLNDILSLNKDFWNKADEPLLFLSFCFELIKLSKFTQDTDNIKTYLPIQLDATCNGLQHLSIMSANQKLAKLVNLLPSTLDKEPNDLYEFVLKQIKEKINKTIREDASYMNLSTLNLDRSIVKRSIMTIAYNVTIKGIVNQLEDFFNKEYIDNTYLYLPKKEHHGIKYITGRDLFKLANIIYNILYETHPELQGVVDYFKEMVNLMNKLNLPIVWITPAGLRIEQKYIKSKSTRIRSGSFKGASYYIVVPTDKIDKNTQGSAFMPNIIHSMDGSTITILIKKLRILGLYNIYTIHDCFATTANNISLINELVRESFCEIYADEKFIYNLHRFFIEYISGNFGVYLNKEKVKDLNIFTDDILKKGNLEINLNGKFIPVPKLPKTGKFKDFKENIQRAIYLIN